MTDFQKEHITSYLALLQQEVHACAKSKGWWDTDRSIPECLMLIVSELAEALEDFRGGDDPQHIYDTCTKPCGFPIELADAVIRILDLAGHLGIDLGEALVTKHAFNLTRPVRHGGKRA